MRNGGPSGGSILWLAWLAWSAAVLPWVAWGFVGDDGLARAAVALGIAVAIGRDGVDAVRAALRLDRWPLVWMAGGLAVALAAPGIDTAGAVGWIAVGYGLVGLGLDRARWRGLGGAVVSAVAVLPSSAMLDPILGWPLRKAIAGVAAAVLGGIPTASVIAIEGGFAHVDLPCAGVRSLWAGVAVLGCAAVAARRPIDRGAVAAFAAFAAVAGAANVARVTALV
ncbi:MAG: archaeosortase/exosortase family protein, partial [Myxococcota bacterium]